MTRFHGYNIQSAPCCGARYRTRRYLSVNFMAGEYWTDGYRERSLMPNDHGLRKCTCGAFFVSSEMVIIDETDTSDLPNPQHVSTDELREAISHPRNSHVELAARLDIWHQLNHAYRAAYRAHRAAEEATSRQAWEAVNPDQRSWIDRLKKRSRVPQYRPSPDRPVTHPQFTPSAQQLENLYALVGLLTKPAHRNDYRLELVELHRELGQFDQATSCLRGIGGREDRFRSLLTTLIRERATAPVRFAY